MLCLCAFFCIRRVLIWIHCVLYVVNTMNPYNTFSCPVLAPFESGKLQKIIIRSLGGSSGEPTLILLVFYLATATVEVD